VALSASKRSGGAAGGGDEEANNGNNDENDEENKEYIYVSFWKACLLFGGYILYVLVCANMKTVEYALCYFTSWCTGNSNGKNNQQEDDLNSSLDKTDGILEGRTEGRNDELPIIMTDDPDLSDPSFVAAHYSLGGSNSTSLGSVHYRSFDDHELHQLPFIYNITTEPIENWDTPDEPTPSEENNDNDIVIANSSFTGDDDNGDEYATNNQKKKKQRNILSRAIHKSFKLIKGCRDDHPVQINDVYELTGNEGSTEIGCFLWQRSVFYTKAYFGSHAFHLRWFTITRNRIMSVPDRTEPHRHVLVYPLFHEVHVDERRLIINLVHPDSSKQDFILMAPNKAIFDAVLRGLEEYMIATRPLRVQGMTELDDDYEEWRDTQQNQLNDTILTSSSSVVANKHNKRDIDADPHVDLIELPRNASPLELALWVSVFPLRLIMHYTLPELRHLDHHGQPQKSIKLAYLSTVSCLIWLIGGSYVMVYSLEHLAALMGIPDGVMGVTISAAGTSLPAYIASRIAAEKGFGNQAVANVFGSNTFNICVGLGLPWVLYIGINGFDPYHDLENDGIIESILVLAGALLIFVVLMLSTNFVLVKWHANLFIGLYIIYIVYAIGQVYW